jgi:hypothetical protein
MGFGRRVMNRKVKNLLNSSITSLFSVITGDTISSDDKLKKESNQAHPEFECMNGNISNSLEQRFLIN